MAEMDFFDINQVVWLDETGCDKRDHLRKFGYALRGQRPVYHRMLHRGKRISAVAALCTDGVIALELNDGTFNGDKFTDFILRTLIPQMQQFDGSSERSVLVMDNCSIHYVTPAQEALSDAGILTVFLPPYSPDLNPMEELFSYIKYYLKDHDELLQSVSDPRPVSYYCCFSIHYKQRLYWMDQT